MKYVTVSLSRDHHISKHLTTQTAYQGHQCVHVATCDTDMITNYKCNCAFILLYTFNAKV